jgi:sulfur carrier protein ThiS
MQPIIQKIQLRRTLSSPCFRTGHPGFDFREKKAILKVPQGTPVRSILERLEPEWQDNAMVLVNGKIANKEDKVLSSDRVLILPLLAGG